MNSALLLRQAIEKLPKNGFKASSKIDVVSNGHKPNCVVKTKNSIIDILDNINKLFDIDNISIKTINILNKKSISKNDIIEINKDKEKLIKILIDSLEYDLDQKISQYNNFSESNPMKGVSLNVNKSNFEEEIKQLIINKKNEINDNNLISIENISKSILNYEDTNLIVYTYNEIDYYDIRHVIINLNLRTTSNYQKYNTFKNKVKYSFWYKNEFGGYVLRELITLEGIKNILAFTVSYGQITLSKILNIDTTQIVVISPEIDCGHKIIETFKHEKCYHKYKIGTYYVDLFFEDYNLIVECDEHDHENYDPIEEEKREKYIINYKINGNKNNFFRYDPFKQNFNINFVISDLIKKIYLE